VTKTDFNIGNKEEKNEPDFERFQHCKTCNKITKHNINSRYTRHSRVPLDGSETTEEKKTIKKK
jgi:hypothetical protein